MKKVELTAAPRTIEGTKGAAALRRAKRIPCVLYGGQETIHFSLEEAALKAHRMAAALVAKNYDAYEFHDRESSRVCVGSFDWIQRALPDGRIQINPDVQRVIEIFGASVTVDPRLGALAHDQFKTELGMPFDLKPTPVEVPRRSVAGDYDRPALAGGR